MNTDLPSREGEDVSFPVTAITKASPMPRTESIVPLEIQSDHCIYRIRIWRVEAVPFSIGEHSDIYSAIKTISAPVLAPNEMFKHIATSLMAFPRVRAVEVLNADSKKGMMVSLVS